MSIQRHHHERYPPPDYSPPYPPPGYGPSAPPPQPYEGYPPPPPLPPQGYPGYPPPGPRQQYDQGYQGYFGEGYPPPPPRPGPPPYENYHYDRHQYHDNSGECTSFIRGCLAALCCCCVLEECF